MRQHGYCSIFRAERRKSSNYIPADPTRHPRPLPVAIRPSEPRSARRQRSIAGLRSSKDCQAVTSCEKRGLELIKILERCCTTHVDLKIIVLDKHLHDTTLGSIEDRSLTFNHHCMVCARSDRNRDL